MFLNAEVRVAIVNSCDDAARCLAQELDVQAKHTPPHGQISR